MPDTEFVLDGLIPEHTLSMVYGPSNLGKSLMVTDWALCLAEGLPWHGRETRQMPVLNVLTEGWDKKKRLRALLDYHRLETVNDNYVWEEEPVNLFTRRGIDQWVAAIREKQAEPKHIFFDTLNSCSYGADENSGQDVGKVLETARRLKKEFGCGITFVHHPPKNAKPSLRGHSSLFNDVDIVILLNGEKNSPHLTLSQEKNKGGPNISFRLERKIVDTRYGTSAIIVPAGGHKGSAPVNILDRLAVKAEDEKRMLQAFVGHTSLSAEDVMTLTGKSLTAVYRAIKRFKEEGQIAETSRGRYTITQIPNNPEGAP